MRSEGFLDLVLLIFFVYVVHSLTSSCMEGELLDEVLIYLVEGKYRAFYSHCWDLVFQSLNFVHFNRDCCLHLLFSYSLLITRRLLIVAPRAFKCDFPIVFRYDYTIVSIFDYEIEECHDIKSFTIDLELSFLLHWRLFEERSESSTCFQIIIVEDIRNFFSISMAFPLFWDAEIKAESDVCSLRLFLWLDALFEV